MTSARHPRSPEDFTFDNLALVGILRHIARFPWAWRTPLYDCATLGTGNLEYMLPMAGTVPAMVPRPSEGVILSSPETRWFKIRSRLGIALATSQEEPQPERRLRWEKEEKSPHDQFRSQEVELDV